MPSISTQLEAELRRHAPRRPEDVLTGHELQRYLNWKKARDIVRAMSDDELATVIDHEIEMRAHARFGNERLHMLTRERDRRKAQKAT